MSIIIGTTTAPYKALSGEDLDWLHGAEDMIAQTLPVIEGDLIYAAALEVDGRGAGVYDALYKRLGQLEAFSPRVKVMVWTFSVDDNDKEINGANRLVRICTGRNMIHEMVNRMPEVSHVMFIDSDLKIPADSLVKLLEMDHPIVGGDVPSYCLGGPWVPEYDFPVQQHWNTAGFLLITSAVARKLRWRSDLQAGSTDDPCFASDAEAMGFGPTYVRKDIIGIHRPLAAVEHRGHDLRIY